ncbi:BTAD domain-containing putative transcriptional regulator [Abyssisolibacter fermentans]|uniref:BTAD domain-containing putative transcriptional regulator n=1 Tax=Abyssisolibacter fermentans TaxID=1766203 RepID=UPI0008299206|nr:BTAD domain-containing putative transcriptional regulator [Abyssisolibacter fermentans]
MTENYCISSKITPPVINSDVIERERLYDLFKYNNGSKISIISAPSGSGKTVLISQFIRWTNQQTIWYQLDEYDNDIITFLRYLVTSISQHCSYSSKLLEHLNKSEQQINELRLYVILLIKELESYVHQPLIIVLEDYHVINNPVIHQFLQELIMYLPEKLYVILSSRYQVPLNIIRYKNHGMVNIIKANNLKFNLSEIRAYFSEKFNFEDDVFQKIKDESDGWAVGISLIKLSLATNDNLIKPQALINTKNYDELYHYFMEEIYSQLSQELKSFLLATSMLNELSVSICNALLHIQNSDVILGTLKRKNLFIIEIDTADGHYRYHQLFRKFLQTQLPDKKPYYKRTADFYLSYGDIVQAIDLYILAQEYEVAVIEIQNTGIQLLEKGSIKTVEKWLKLLPNHLCTNNALLLLLKGMIYNHLTKWQKSIVLLDKAILMNKDNNNKVYVKALFYKANSYRKMGKYEDSLNIINMIIPILEKESINHWYKIILEKINILLWIGNLREAIYTLKKIIDRSNKEDTQYFTALFLEHLGATYYASGEYYKAIDYYKQAYSKYENLEDSISEFEKEYYSQRSTMARIYRDWGETDKAHELIIKEISIKERLGLLNDLPRAYHQLALIYHDYGKKNKALTYFDKASELFTLLDINDFQWTWHEALYGKILIDYNEKQKGIYLIEKAIENSKKNSEFNKAVCNVFGSYISLAKGEIKQALNTVNQSLIIGKKINAQTLISLCHMMKANIYLILDKRDLALESTIKCLELAEKNNYIEGFVSYNPNLNPLVQFAKDQGIFVEFINKVLKRSPQTKENIENIKDIHISCKSKVKPLIYVKLFGNMAILDSNNNYLKEYQLKTTKAHELLAYLLLNTKEGTLKEEILEALWPEKDPKKSSNLLYTYSYEIRSLLKKIGISNSLQYKNKRYSISKEKIDCDVFQFTREINSQNINNIEHAIKLYNKKFINSFDNLWITNTQKGLEKVYLQALLKTANYYIKLKNYDMSKVYLERLIETDNLSETAYELLMNLHIQFNNNIAAINTYKTYQMTLYRELGIHPNNNMIKLYQRALNS